MATSAIDKLRQQITYPRPRQLSDPYWDFTADHLEQMLATPDDELVFSEFRNLFGPFLPAGTYEEVIYFLPLAFAYFAQPENEGEPHEIVLSLVGFTSDHVENLKADGLLEIVGDCFEECFQSWTKTFTVTHFESYSGRTSRYRDNIAHLTLLSETIYQMRLYQTFLATAGEFVQQLGNNESDPIKAAWFLAYAANEYLRDDQTPDMFKFKFDAIQSAILDHDRLKKAAQLVRRDPTLWNASPTYWYDTFDTLGLDDYIYLPES